MTDPLRYTPTPDDRAHMPEGARLLLEAFARSLHEVGELDAARADHCAFAALREVLRQCGGGYFYVPKEDKFLRHQRDAQIWADFSGHNHAELARRYRVSQPYVYNIIARQRAAERARRSRDLF